MQVSLGTNINFKHDPPKNVAEELENALIDLRGAVDANGLKIFLGPRSLDGFNAEGMRKALATHCQSLTASAVFLHQNGELNWVDNLILLANAHRALLRYLATLPASHSGGCSNQNVLDPLGAYKGADECGCNRKA